jgi:eukaryotic-like serine/threonine-protein kinase
MVMELMSMDLETLIFTKGEGSLGKKLKILREIAEGVVFLHDNGVIHRDLKPKNILLDDNLSAKITDLGIAKVLENKEKTENATMAFTARYASRESAIDNITTFKADIWSLGLLMYETLSHRKAWGVMNSTKILLQLNSKATPLEEGWEKNLPVELVDCVLRCVEYDIDKRLSAKEVLQRLQKIDINTCAPSEEEKSFEKRPIKK